VNALPGAAAADPWKDESGKGRWRAGEFRDDYRRHYAREYKEEFRRSDARSSASGSGEYKEGVKCKERRW
jgi:hypothetical protein